MNAKNSNRLGRIDEELKKGIRNIINYELNNPKNTGVISGATAKTTPEYKDAKVYVSILNSKNVKDTLANLKKSSGFIRSEIAKRINLRITPELIFVLDDSMEYGAKIDQILKEILPKKED